MNRTKIFFIIGVIFIGSSTCYRIYIIEQVWGLENETQLLYNHYLKDGTSVFVGFPIVHIIGIVGAFFMVLAISGFQGHDPETHFIEYTQTRQEKRIE